ncbi:hypothetical protein GHK92_01430 [Nocardioides sp. dk4132]|uniref:hypothetical protein n=1 Tax=unclassified Nocardioides TaxID=2615069 RepID=UPI001295C788|nr:MULTISPECIES: hypothetical protein [unclassified Nocardioides]MQW74528.1 hypothetical protein [Nocardioides sp. dk4132]QGA06454.1 hypothetical protein GFH29_02875 [Nocardioides sp. dk884]
MLERVPAALESLLDVATAAAPAVLDDPLARSLLVSDLDLPSVSREDGGVPVSVVLTGGAGQVAGPAAYCTRNGLALSALVITLRDPGDLAGNARRVVAAVDAARAEGALADDATVQVVLPAEDPTYAWLAAADEVAGAELGLRLPVGGPERPPVAPATLAAWIDAALDRETAFAVAGAGTAYGDSGRGVLALLRATLAAFDGAARGEVVALLADPALADLDLDELARARRWCTSVESADLAAVREDLRGLGLLERA